MVYFAAHAQFIIERHQVYIKKSISNNHSLFLFDL